MILGVLGIRLCATLGGITRKVGWGEEYVSILVLPRCRVEKFPYERNMGLPLIFDEMNVLACSICAVG